jgi:hypothetical protein
MSFAVTQQLHDVGWKVDQKPMSGLSAAPSTNCRLAWHISNSGELFLSAVNEQLNGDGGGPRIGIARPTGSALRSRGVKPPDGRRGKHGGTKCENKNDSGYKSQLDHLPKHEKVRRGASAATVAAAVRLPIRSPRRVTHVRHHTTTHT